MRRHLEKFEEELLDRSIDIDSEQQKTSVRKRKLDRGQSVPVDMPLLSVSLTSDRAVQMPPAGVITPQGDSGKGSPEKRLCQTKGHVEISPDGSSPEADAIDNDISQLHLSTPALTPGITPIPGTFSLTALFLFVKN